MLLNDCFDTAVRKNALTLVMENSERSWKVMELKSSKSTNLVFRACACACVASENRTRTAPSKEMIFSLSQICSARRLVTELAQGKYVTPVFNCKSKCGQLAAVVFVLLNTQNLQSFDVVLQRTAKKCTKVYNARAQPFCSFNLSFGDVFVTVAVVIRLKNPPQISDETWYDVITVQGDVKNVIKRGGHRACFHATMLTNMVIQVTFGYLGAQQISSIIFQCSVLYHTEFDFL